MSDAQIVDAARAYVKAKREADDTTNLYWTERQNARYAAWHDLAALVTGECEICDEGTCPVIDIPRETPAHVGVVMYSETMVTSIVLHPRITSLHNRYYVCDECASSTDRSSRLGE